MSRTHRTIATSVPHGERVGRPGACVAAAALLLGGLGIAVAGPAAAVPTSAEPTGPCPDDEGVTVVVDLTDLGGDVEVGCAEGAGTGTEALHSAGFTETRDDAGMICAINGLPDPCPTTWEGVYWSYWTAEPGGEWQFHEVGSDESAPEPGSVEGWRYHDGSEGPTIAPPVPGEPVRGADGATGTEADEPEASGGDATDPGTAETDGPADSSGDTTTEDGADDPATDTDDAASPTTDDVGGPSPAVLAGLGLLVVLVVAAVVVARRRARDPNGPAGQH